MLSSIAPNVKSVDVLLNVEDVRVTGSLFQTVEQNTTTALFHEIGERNSRSSVEYRGGVIDYENYVRKIIGLPVRPYDLNHKPYIPNTNR